MTNFCRPPFLIIISFNNFSVFWEGPAVEDALPVFLCSPAHLDAGRPSLSMLSSAVASYPVCKEVPDYSWAVLLRLVCSDLAQLCCD